MILLLLVLLTNPVLSQKSLPFQEIPYSDLFQKALAEQKPIFLYFHFDGCGACAQMENQVFNQPEVTSFFDKNFLCYEINTLKGEGKTINKEEYQVQLHPTFLFLSETGDILHKAVGVLSPDDFISEAKSALDPQKSLKAFREHYRNGNRKANFLYAYCYKLRNAYELDSLVINQYLLTQSYQDLFKEKNLRFIYEFLIHHFTVSMPYESREFLFLWKNKEVFSKYFPEEQVNTRIAWILNSTVYQAIEEGNKEKYQEVLALLEAYDRDRPYYFKELDGRTTGMVMGKNMVLMAEMTWYEKTGNKEKYQKALHEYITSIWYDASALNSFAWNYYTQYEEKEQLEQALEWIERSIALKAGYNNTDTYAALLYKLGKYEEALKQADKAIAFARKEERNYESTQKLVVQIKNRNKKQQ